MRYLAAGLIYVAVSTVAGLFVGMGGGLDAAKAFLALMVGSTAAIAAFYSTSPDKELKSSSAVGRGADTRSPWLWLLGFIFAIFALRSFLWLLYYDKDAIYIQSPNNLGDLGLHITYIKNFASGVNLWPESPLYPFSKLRYPAGIDLFNGLFACLGIDLRHQLIATALVASLATFYALYRWGGGFAIAGFLFNGGIAGYQVLLHGQFRDYQGASYISWKSIALSMFVTQRGLLYAIPAGLLLLWQWRAKYGSDTPKRLLPIWIEYLLYATMPLFHIHAFIALSIVLAVLFLVRPNSRRRLLVLVGSAFVPATLFIGLVSDNFHAGSILALQPGWTQKADEFAMPFFRFWFVNFGVFLPLAIVLVAVVAWRGFRASRDRPFELSTDSAFLVAAVFIFLFAYFVRTAPWEWDNIKILIWAYLIVLPVLWKRLLADWPLAARVGTCFLIFFSGFVSLLGGLAAGRPGFEFANRSEVDYVADAVRTLPIEARFACYPTYNHPLLLNGRKVACGYPGHLWTQGISYEVVEGKLRALMLGQGDWRRSAAELHVRYLFWGPQEKENYAASSRPWETTLAVVKQGPWGAIYDFSSPRS